MTAEPNLSTVERLITDLQSEDAFDRREAIEKLARLTRQRLDFRWRGPETDRLEAIRRWRKWVKRERRRRRNEMVEKTILSGGGIDATELQKLLKDLPSAEKQAVFAAMVKKIGLLGTAGSAAAAALSAAMSAPLKAAGAAGSAMRCEICSKGVATARVTSRDDDGDWQRRAACETCVARLDW